MFIIKSCLGTAVILFFFSCTYFQKINLNITPNSLSGKTVFFSKLDQNYARKNQLHKDWMKAGSKRFKSYYRLRGKKFKILGDYLESGQKYLMIEDAKNRIYLREIIPDKGLIPQLPSYVVFDSIFEEANNLINKEVWLNDILNSNVFYSFANHRFRKFDLVRIVDVIDFQNSRYGYPIWLKVVNENSMEAYVRYNGPEKIPGRKENYFINDPLPPNWGEHFLRLIKNGEVDLGMTPQQVRVAIGNPVITNYTSSIHGVSEQWIYQNKDLKKTFLQFEFGKLSYINE